MSQIHPTAIVESTVEVGNHVTIEPYAVIKGHVVLEDDVVIKSHAYLDGYTLIGRQSVIFPFASIGTQTQDLKFQGEKTFVRIGAGSTIREYVTINGSCGEGTEVVVGDHCHIMSYCHIAHNCEVGNHVIMSNSATLAGHVTVGDYAIIGGFTPVHQFSRIGAHAMVGGMSRVVKDVPPYTLGGGDPYKIAGLNLVGLKRRGFSLGVRKALTRAYKITYHSGLRVDEAMELIRSENLDVPEVKAWIDFCLLSKRGLICHSVSGTKAAEKVDLLQESSAG